MTYSEIFEAMGKPFGQLLEEQRQAMAQQDPEAETSEETDYDEIINLIFDTYGR